MKPGSRQRTGAARGGAWLTPLLLVLLVLVGAPVAPGVAATLAPHTASYSIRHLRSDRESGVGSVRGRLELRFESSCDGWRFDQHLGLVVFDTEGDTVEHLSNLQGWETRDGPAYWFSLRGYEDRREIENLSGVARLGPGEPSARFGRPQPHTVALTPDTLFPVAHIHALVDSALAGERHHVKRVFDGTVGGPGFEISAVIGAGAPPGAREEFTLGAQRAWPLRLAFFEIGKPGSEPVFQMGLTLLDNGIATALEYDYGTFSMAVEMESLEALPVPEC